MFAHVVAFFSMSYAGAANEEQMQQIMQQCMANIDEAGMDRLARKGKQMEEKLRTLCDAGERDKAEKTAIAYGKTIADSKVIEEFKKCGDMASDIINSLPMSADPSAAERHVCDSY